MSRLPRWSTGVTAFALAAVGILSCDNATDGPVVAALLVVPNPVPLLQRDSVQLVVTGQTSGGATVPGLTFTYASADTAIARVSATGRVRSADVRGTTSLNVTGRGLTVPVAVTVSARITSLTVAPNPVQLNRRDSVNLAVTALDVVNQPVAGVAFTYSSSDTTKATVSGTGRVRARDSLGTAQLTIAGGGVTTQVPVTVTTVAAAVLLTPGDTTIRPGGSFQFTGRVLDQFGLPAPGTVTYESNANPIVMVTGGGLATSVGPFGNAVITGRSGVASGSSSVWVLDSNILARKPLGGGPYGAAISSAGVAYVTLLGPGQLARADLPAQTFAPAVTVGSIPTEVAFNSTGARAYVTNQFSSTVTVVNVATNAPLETFAVTGNPFEVIVTPGDSILYVSTNVDSVFGIRLTTKAIVARFQTPAIGNGFVIRADTLLYVSTHGGGTVIEFNLRTRTVARTFVVGGTPQKMALSANGNELYITNEAGYVQFWDLVTGLQIGVNLALPGGGGYGMARRPSNGPLYVSTATAAVDNIHIVDPATRTLVHSIAVGGRGRRVVFNASGSIGFVANEGGWVDFLR